MLLGLNGSKIHISLYSHKYWQLSSRIFHLKEDIGRLITFETLRRLILEVNLLAKIAGNKYLLYIISTLGFGSGGRLLAGVVLFNGCTLYYYFNHVRPKIAHELVEKKSAFLATLPLLLAERDRAYRQNLNPQKLITLVNYPLFF